MNYTKILNKIIPIIGIVVFISLSSSNLYSQCGMMKGHGNHSSHEMKSSDVGDTSIIRKGIINVYEIDFNMDGFVYQDPMHWNVISDKTGNCPFCGMELIKTKNEAAIKNLKEHDFKIKE